MVPSRPGQRPLHMGRGVFLGAMAAGVAGLTLPIRELPGFRMVASAFSIDGFEIYTTSGVPIIRADQYRLRVDGLVARPLAYRLTDLMEMPRTRVIRDYHCVTGWTVPHVSWTGVALGDFLRVLRPLGRASYLQFASADGSYTESLDLQQAHLPDVMLAYQLNDRPLSQEQGFPLRLVVPEMYGFKYIKWVDHITLSADLVPGYWENRGYAIDAWLGPRSNYGRDTGPQGQR